MEGRVTDSWITDKNHRFRGSVANKVRYCILQLTNFVLSTNDIVVLGAVNEKIKSSLAWMPLTVSGTFFTCNGSNIGTGCCLPLIWIGSNVLKWTKCSVATCVCSSTRMGTCNRSAAVISRALMFTKYWSIKEIQTSYRYLQPLQIHVLLLIPLLHRTIWKEEFTNRTSCFQAYLPLVMPMFGHGYCAFVKVLFSSKAACTNQNNTS